MLCRNNFNNDTANSNADSNYKSLFNLKKIYIFKKTKIEQNHIKIKEAEEKAEEEKKKHKTTVETKSKKKKTM